MDTTGSGTEVGHNHMNFVYNSNNKKVSVFVCVCTLLKEAMRFYLSYLWLLYTVHKVKFISLVKYQTNYNTIK